MLRLSESGRIPALSSCEMTVALTSTLHETKEIQAFNLFLNNWVDSISTFGSGQTISMNIRRATNPRTSVRHRRRYGRAVPAFCVAQRGRTALYTFPPEDFWDFWGGCKVTFEWFSDTVANGEWGSQTPEPRYPSVRFPDGTLLRQDILLPDGRETERFWLVFGGAAFGLGYGDLGAFGFDAVAAASALRVSLAARSVDAGELHPGPRGERPRRSSSSIGREVWIPDPPTLFRLGFDWSRVRVIPAGGTSQLSTMPINGTLIKEEHDPKVFLVDNNKLRWVTSPAAMDGRCLPWRHIHVVPDNSLTPLAHGLDLGPP